MGWKVGQKNVIEGGKAAFEQRQRAAKETDTRYRQPFAYRDVKWEDAPETVRLHHQDIAVMVFASLGIEYDDKL